MMEANNILRDIFVEMGFKEMQGPMVESEFWCFDASLDSARPSSKR
jgi:phenylalanyl-tRNA synthetase alpha subunit